MIAVDDLISLVRDYNPKTDEALIRDAYAFGHEMHAGQTRHSGEPYFTHPVAVAAILTEQRLDDATIVTALLHDTVEDTKASYRTVEARFGTEIAELVEKTVTRESFQSKYADVFKGDEKWQAVETDDALTYSWPSTSTYVQNPPYFQGMGPDAGVIEDVKGARILAMLGDSVTTDHISPAGSFKADHPAGRYLMDRQVPQREFNSYGSRRGNHEGMMRGTFANIRIRNEMLDGVEGGYTLGPDGEQMPIYDAAMAYQEQGNPLVIVAGKEYGTGSSRDWAAKGTALLGVKAVIAESFERIHRSNLVGMGVIPLEFTGGDDRHSLGLTGAETVDITGLAGDLSPQAEVPAVITYADGKTKEITLKCRIDTAVEIEYVENGGVLHYVLRNLAKSA